MSSSMTTVLRVKRPRNAAPVPILSFPGKKRARVDDFDDLVDALAGSSFVSSGSQVTVGTPRARDDHLVWKRKETALEPDQAAKFISKRSLKCVDAVLEGEPSSKRQRQLVLVQKSPSSSPAAKKQRQVLDPASRLVKDSLELVQEGTKTVQQHVNYIEQDSRLLMDCKKWILVQCSDGSNILHLCALWNDVETCRRLCMVYASPALLDHPDHSQQRPYQVAQLAHHTNVAKVLEAFGADTNDFVYDIYHLHKEEMEVDKEEVAPLRVDLSGGVGYWNEHGELILEALCPEDFGDVDSLQDDDEDEDSNAEDAEANDYPDEEESSDDDEGDFGADDTYRHEPIYNMPAGSQTSYPSSGYIHDDDDEYDTQYGLYDLSGGPAEPRIYAYDPNHDDEADD
jgi:Transcription factor Iwr1